MSFRWASTSFSNDFMTTDVRATGLKSFSPVILDFFGMGMMMERLKHEGTSHNSSDLLKFYVKMGASLSARYHLGLVLFPFLLPEDLAHLVFTDMNCRCRGEGLLEVLMVVWRGVQSECGLFFSNLQ